MLTPVDGNFDKPFTDQIAKNRNTIISFWLLCSYCYYLRHESLVSDELFDRLSKEMLVSFDDLEHQHKHLITKDMLGAGTGYNLGYTDYPLIVRVTSEYFIKNLHQGHSS